MVPQAHHEGVYVRWEGLTVTVPVKKSAERKTLLAGVSGKASPARLLCILGPSGAGKSTLLDVLAGQTPSSSGLELGGDVYVNGAPLNRSTFRRLSSYVQQREVLVISATVREVITTSALLKLPPSITRAEKLERVQSVLSEMDLEDCADTLIGDEAAGIKGVSGGQKRRVCIGAELVKDPSIIFLDEPTSGLDSEMALSCMEVLRRLARSGRTVVSTIHQPNSDITALFDDLLVLAAGHVVYLGPWSGAVDHFAVLGHSCPTYRNPTDFFLYVLRDDKVAEELWTRFETSGRATLAQGADGSADAALALPLPPSSASVHVAVPGGGEALTARKAGLEDGGSGLLTKIGSGPREGMVDVAALARPEAPWWEQVAVLVDRQAKAWVRNPNMLVSELAQYIFLGLLIGLMYCGSMTDDVDDGVINRVACIWFTLVICSFTPSFTTVVLWGYDRPVLRRELSQNMYSIEVWYVARSLVLIPFDAIQSVLFMCIFYFFAGLARDAGKFFTFLLMFFLFQIISEGIGLMCAVAAKDPTAAMVLSQLVLIGILCFSGFLVTRIPVYARWLYHTVYLAYAWSGLVRNEFDGLTLYDADGDPVPGLSAVPTAYYNEFGVWTNVGIVAAQLAGMEVLKLVVLKVWHKMDWL